MGNLPEYTFPHRQVWMPTRGHEKTNQSSYYFLSLCFCLFGQTEPRREQGSLSPRSEDPGVGLQPRAKGSFTRGHAEAWCRDPSEGLAFCEMPNFCFQPAFNLPVSLGLPQWWPCPRGHKAAFPGEPRGGKLQLRGGVSLRDWPYSSPAHGADPARERRPLNS